MSALALAASELPASEARARLDVERIVQWALAPGRPGGIRWRDQAALAFDHGCTAQPRRKPRGSWALVIAGSGLSQPRRVELAGVADDDAGLVLSAVRALAPAAAALVIHHGRERTRPGWTETVEERMPCWIAPGRAAIRYADPHRKALPYCPLKITPREVVSAAAICRYRAWWGGLLLVAEFVGGRLQRWEVSGLSAPECPWKDCP